MIIGFVAFVVIFGLLFLRKRYPFLTPIAWGSAIVTCFASGLVIGSLMFDSTILRVTSYEAGYPLAPWFGMWLVSSMGVVYLVLQSK